jgi:acetylglutamate synthase
MSEELGVITTIPVIGEKFQVPNFLSKDTSLSVAAASSALLECCKVAVLVAVSAKGRVLVLTISTSLKKRGLISTTTIFVRHELISTSSRTSTRVAEHHADVYGCYSLLAYVGGEMSGSTKVG